MDISVVGAGGAIGRGIVALLVADRVLKPTERLQIIGRGGGASERALFGLRSDLTDAYVETAPQIDIGLGVGDLVGDVVIMTAGVTPGARAGAKCHATTWHRRTWPCLSLTRGHWQSTGRGRKW